MSHKLIIHSERIMTITNILIALGIAFAIIGAAVVIFIGICIASLMHDYCLIDDDDDNENENDE